MTEAGYYGDQPSFQRKDALMRWTFVLFIAAVVATLWVMLVFLLLASETIGDGTDVAFGLEQSTWAMIAAVLLVLTLVGLVFVVVARLGGTAGGAYLSAQLREDEARKEAEDQQEEAEEEPATPAADANREHRRMLLRGARIEDPFGPDGRMVLSYTHPDNARAGVFGDTYVAVDTDAVLNVRTLLYAPAPKL